MRVLDPVPALMSSIWLLTHPDLRETPRVKAFFDFVVAEIGRFKPLLSGKAHAQTR